MSRRSSHLDPDERELFDEDEQVEVLEKLRRANSHSNDIARKAFFLISFLLTIIKFYLVVSWTFFPYDIHRVLYPSQLFPTVAYITSLFSSEEPPRYTKINGTERFVLILVELFSSICYFLPGLCMLQFGEVEEVYDSQGESRSELKDLDKANSAFKFNRTLFYSCCALFVLLVILTLHPILCIWLLGGNVLFFFICYQCFIMMHESHKDIDILKSYSYKQKRF
eukprot:TRINITY_DN1024_c0_g1_i1.p1 TRINITY_DN1024_c0_g1~~TRINITY_DN1024_c0_g1_i1.p1  ORF type:complete len:224 (-),score=27.17 TRINITY_DN1024_c0_g1_i1:361-1032(-)